MLAAALNTLIGGGQRANPLLFHAPLTTSIVPTKGIGAATFTRASTATVVDHEGIIRTCKANEARFYGARRVENICSPASNGIAGWTEVDTPGTLDVVAAPDGEGVVITGLVPAVNDPRAEFNNQLSGVEVYQRSFRFSWEVKALDDGTGLGQAVAIQCFRHTGAAGAAAVETCVLTGEWVRYSITYTGTAAGQYGLKYQIFSAATNGTTACRFRRWQIEEITGQALDVPSEYVSVGELSAPYHGANVDGVKYFDYANGNSVDVDGVVTEAQGAALTTYMGYFAEGSRTNNITREDITHADILKLRAIATDMGYSALGRKYYRLEDDVSDQTNTTHYIRKTGAHTVGQNAALSIRAKAGTCTKIMVGNNVGRFVKFDLSAGTIIAEQLAVGQIMAMADGWYWCSIGVQGANVLDGNYDVYMLDAAGNHSYVAGAGQHVFLCCPQDEPGLFASSYIPTDGASATRATDRLEYPGAMFSDQDGSAYAEAALNYNRAMPVSQTRPRVISGGLISSASALTFSPTLNAVECWDGTTAVNTGGSSANLIQMEHRKMASSWGGSGFKRIAVNGVISSESAFDGSMHNGSTVLDIGAGSGIEAQTLFGVVKNVRTYRKEFTPARLLELTA